MWNSCFVQSCLLHATLPAFLERRRTEFQMVCLFVCVFFFFKKKKGVLGTSSIFRIVYFCWGMRRKWGGENSRTLKLKWFLNLLAKKKKSVKIPIRCFLSVYIFIALCLPEGLFLLVLCSLYFWSFRSKVQVYAHSEPYFQLLRRSREAVSRYHQQMSQVKDFQISSLFVWWRTWFSRHHCWINKGTYLK